MAVKIVSTRFSDTLFSFMRNITYLKHDAEQLSTISFWFLTSELFTLSLFSTNRLKLRSAIVRNLPVLQFTD